MKKLPTTNTERVERQHLKEIEAFKLDRRVLAAMEKELDAFPAPKIATHSGALRSPLGDLKP